MSVHLVPQMLDDMPGIVGGAENYAGLARMQPVEAKKVQPVDFRDAAPSIRIAEFVEDRKVDPRKVEAEPGGPYHAPDTGGSQVKPAWRSGVVAYTASQIRIFVIRGRGP